MNTITVRKPKVAVIETLYTTAVRIDGNDYEFVTRYHRRVESPRRGRILETYLRHDGAMTWFDRLFNRRPHGRLSREEIDTAVIAVENKVQEMM